MPTWPVPCQPTLQGQGGFPAARNITTYPKVCPTIKDKIKDELARQDGLEEFTDYIVMTVHINNRLYKRCTKRSITRVCLYQADIGE